MSEPKSLKDIFKSPISKSSSFKSYSFKIPSFSRSKSSKSSIRLTSTNTSYYKLKISKYFDNLFKFLNKYCFIKGAFVIEDNGDKLYELLNDVEDQTDLTVLHLESHTKYKDKEYHLMEMNLEPHYITVNCVPDENCKKSRQYKSFKWYRFHYGGQKFIFVKPEREPTLTFIHGKNSVSRYLLKSAKKEEDCLRHRREDCSIDNNCDYTIGDQLPYRNFQHVIINDTTYVVEETYERKGDEAFIIEPVSEFIIDLINNGKIDDIKFRYDFDNNNMVITSHFTGGKYKKYSKKKKTLLKKNKTIRRKRNISKKRVRKGKY
jgi:hypothetical protein